MSLTRCGHQSWTMRARSQLAPQSVDAAGLGKVPASGVVGHAEAGREAMAYQTKVPTDSSGRVASAVLPW
jgi:hypothetical protein